MKLTLETKTRMYWHLSRCWNRSIGIMTVEHANKQIRTIKNGTGPHRKLRARIDALGQDIIFNQVTPKGIDDEKELEA